MLMTPSWQLPDGASRTADLTLKPMHVPEQPDAVELERLLMRLSALIELRAAPENEFRARQLLATIEHEIDTTFNSGVRHREWRVRRYRVLELMAELDQILYYQMP